MAQVGRQTVRLRVTDQYEANNCVENKIDIKVFNNLNISERQLPLNIILLYLMEVGVQKCENFFRRLVLKTIIMPVAFNL